MKRKALVFGVPIAILVVAIVLGLALGPVVYPKAETAITAKTSMGSLVAGHNEDVETDMQRFVLLLVFVVSGAACSGVTGYLLWRRQ